MMTVQQFRQRCVDPMGEESDHVHIVALTNALQARLWLCLRMTERLRCSWLLPASTPSFNRAGTAASIQSLHQQRAAVQLWCNTNVSRHVRFPYNTIKQRSSIMELAPRRCRCPSGCCTWTAACTRAAMRRPSITTISSPKSRLLAGGDCRTVAEHPPVTGGNAFLHPVSVMPHAYDDVSMA